MIFLNKTDSSRALEKIILHRTEFFLVKGYTPEQKDQHIDRFARKNRSSGFQKYDSYDMIFIKESAEINEKQMPANSETLDAPGFYVHKDFIYNYFWEKGVFKGKLKFDNGKVIDTIKNKLQ